MSPWLRKRLFAWTAFSLAVGGALIWTGAASHAQESEFGERIYDGPLPRPKLSRDDAAKSFANLMKVMPDTRDLASLPPNRRAILASSISAKTEKELGAKTTALLTEMASYWNTPRQTVRLESEAGNTATVLVEPETKTTGYPLVLVEENGAWGVDLVETYAKWNGLEGDAKLIAILRITGVELPGLSDSPDVERARESLRRYSCQVNMKRIMLGVLQYSQDYDERLPGARAWIDEIKYYVPDRNIFTCPSVPQGQRYGYAYSVKLSHKPLSALEAPAQMVAVYETTVLKRNAYGLGEDIAYRHENGANYAFGDGHIKWFSREKRPSFNFSGR